MSKTKTKQDAREVIKKDEKRTTAVPKKESSGDEVFDQAILSFLESKEKKKSK